MSDASSDSGFRGRGLLSRGCCCGCLATGLTTLLVIAVISFFLDKAYSLFTPVPRVALDEYFGTDHPVVLRIDPNSEILIELMGEAGNSQTWVMRYLWPYEVMAFIDVNRGNQTKDLTWAISTRRGGGLLSTWWPVPDNIDLGGGFKVTDFRAGSDGVIQIMADGKISDDALVEGSEYVADDGFEPYTLTRDHILELILDNRKGDAYLALEAYFGGDIDDADSQVEGDTTSPTDVAHEDFLNALQQTIAMRMTMDLVDTNSMEWTVEARAFNVDGAEALLDHLNRVRDTLIENAEDKHMEFEGEFTRDGSEVHGELILRHYRRSLVERSHDFLEELDDSEENVTTIIR